MAGDLTTEATPVVEPTARPFTWARVGWLASLVLVPLAVLTVVILFMDALDADSVAIDFRQYYGAAEAILRR